MEKKISTYEAGDLTIKFDAERCLHSGECVKNLGSVFDPTKQPWIQPEEVSADQIKDTVQRCPSGALQYNGSDLEKPTRKNTITIAPDGPLYLRGDIEIQNSEGETMLEDTRVAICRCGESKNKPLCDNSHQEIEFEAPTGFDKTKLQPTDDGDSSTKKLILKLMDNGPILLEGPYQIHSIANQPVNSTKNAALCRCGKSDGKPFCDGKHKDIGFEG